MSKYPTAIKELPKEPFFALLYPESVTIPGDERSRTNPGHGYPEHRVDGWSMQVFSNEADWRAAIERSAGLSYSKAFVPVKIIPATVTVERHVTIE